VILSSRIANIFKGEWFEGRTVFEIFIIIMRLHNEFTSGHIVVIVLN